MNEFKRENRYLVLKLSDIEKYLSVDQKMQLRDLDCDVGDGRERAGKLPLKAVVVEHDWPEYEPTWEAIEARVNKINGSDL